MAAGKGGAGVGDSTGVPGGTETTGAPGASAPGEASLIINQQEEAQYQQRDPQRLDAASRLPCLQPPHRFPGQGRPRRTRAATSTQGALGESRGATLGAGKASVVCYGSEHVGAGHNFSLPVLSVLTLQGL